MIMLKLDLWKAADCNIIRGCRTAVWA